MEEREKRQIGEQLEPGGRPKAPGRLELLQRFVNTYNHDFPEDWDRLGTGAKAEQWLRAKGLFDGPVSDDEAAELRKVREALRALIVLHLGGMSAALVVTVDDAGQSALEPAEQGIARVKATLLAIVHEAQLSGEWSRMKGCRQCEYAFYDRSKNRSATWCAMSICGNRTKNRAYYARRRSP